MTNKPLVVATPFPALLPAKPAAAITILTGNQYKNRYKEDLQTELNDTMERHTTNPLFRSSVTSSLARLTCRRISRSVGVSSYFNSQKPAVIFYRKLPP